MKRRYYPIIAIILVTVVVAGVVYLGYSSRIQPFSTPKTLYNYGFSSPDGSVISDVMNVSQGETQQLNLTLTSMNNSPEISIPIENITLTAYNSTVDYNGNWDTSGWNTSIIQESVFNYSFSLNQIILQPNTSNSTIITIQWANNAPTGRYALQIDLGNFKFLSTAGEHDKSYGSTIWLGAIVTPNMNPLNENLTYINFDGGYNGNNWNMTFTLKNTGTTTATITDFVIDGQSYSSINPSPTINPTIENGYALPPNQTVTVTIQGTSPQPFHNGGKLYVVTATGNSYLFYLSSGL